MKKEDQEKLEATVIQAVRGGAHRFHLIHGATGLHKSMHRVVDRILQNLRKRGDLRYDSVRGWSITNRKASDE